MRNSRGGAAASAARSGPKFRENTRLASFGCPARVRTLRVAFRALVSGARPRGQIPLCGRSRPVSSRPWSAADTDRAISGERTSAIPLLAESSRKTQLRTSCKQDGSPFQFISFEGCRAVGLRQRTPSRRGCGTYPPLGRLPANRGKGAFLPPNRRAWPCGVALPACWQCLKCDKTLPQDAPRRFAATSALPRNQRGSTALARLTEQALPQPPSSPVLHTSASCLHPSARRTTLPADGSGP